MTPVKGKGTTRKCAVRKQTVVQSSVSQPPVGISEAGMALLSCLTWMKEAWSLCLHVNKLLDVWAVLEKVTRQPRQFTKADD